MNAVEHLEAAERMAAQNNANAAQVARAHVSIAALLCAAGDASIEVRVLTESAPPNGGS